MSNEWIIERNEESALEYLLRLAPDPNLSLENLALVNPPKFITSDLLETEGGFSIRLSLDDEQITTIISLANRSNDGLYYVYRFSLDLKVRERVLNQTCLLKIRVPELEIVENKNELELKTTNQFPGQIKLSLNDQVERDENASNLIYQLGAKPRAAGDLIRVEFNGKLVFEKLYRRELSPWLWLLLVLCQVLSTASLLLFLFKGGSLGAIISGSILGLLTGLLVVREGIFFVKEVFKQGPAWGTVAVLMALLFFPITILHLLLRSLVNPFKEVKAATD